VTDNLFNQHTISTESIGIFFAPVTASPNIGELTFGGVDPSKNTSAVQFTPITETRPSSAFWGVDQSISYGSKTILGTSAGIVDTGTTLVMLATGSYTNMLHCSHLITDTMCFLDAFNAYQAATGGVPDAVTGLLSITLAQFQALKPLDFHIGGETYSLSPNAQIWPRALNVGIGGKPNSIYLIVADVSDIWPMSCL